MNNEYFSSINDVSKRLGVPAHTLRYWEKQFPTIIRPTTGAGGRRYYRTETVERLIIIKDLLYVRGLTIAGVKKMLRDGDLPKNIDDFLAASACSPETIAAAVAPVVSAPKGVSVECGDKIKFAIDLLTQAKSILQ